MALECRDTVELLQQFLTSELTADQLEPLRTLLDRRNATMKERHLAEADDLSTHQPHAQAWVISALYGMILYCGNQLRAAGEALSFAQSAAYLVGDLQTYDLIQELLSTLQLATRAIGATQTPTIEPSASEERRPVIAFIPSLDNVNAKANLYGVPPVLFTRALLHRAMLFADKIAISPNVLTNSNVFVNDILFAGRGEMDRFYLDFLQPIIVHERDLQQERAMLAMYQASNARSDYISESLSESHMVELDDYFLDAGIENRFIYFSQHVAASNYLRWMRRAVSELRLTTATHLMDLWRHFRTFTFAAPSDVVRLDEELASDMVDCILSVVDDFTRSLNGPLTRSKLYNLAGLFVTVVDDQEAQVREDLDPAIRERLVSGRARLLERPWISGPLCHELFDVPYRWNPVVHLTTTTSATKSIVFLEEHEKASMRFMANLASDQGDVQIGEDTVSVGEISQISALLLGQASKHDIERYRAALAPIRDKLAMNAPLDAGTRALLVTALGMFKRASVDVEGAPITELAVLPEQTKTVLLEFLKHCVMLVRKGDALDRMYEEPQFTVPGVLRLERSEP